MSPVDESTEAFRAVGIAAMALIGMAAAYRRATRATRRQRRIAGFAGSHDLRYGNVATQAFLAQFREFVPFASAVSEVSSNHIFGRRGGIQWDAFDYALSPHPQLRPPRRRYGILVARAGFDFPKISIRPREGAALAADGIKGETIEFESAAFDRKYRVTCDDRRRAHGVLVPRVLEYLLESPAIDWQFGGDAIVLHRRGVYSAQQLEWLMGHVTGLLERIPDYLRGTAPRGQEGRRT